MIGLRFGRLVVVACAGVSRNGSRLFDCKCDCGKAWTAYGCHLKSGHSKSCGCLKIDVTRKRATRHGGTVGGGFSPEYSSWASMWSRVRGVTERDRRDYVERGISVCDRWKLFENFLADMGPRPSGTSIDRKNNDGNYEPGNCKWSTPIEQARNQRQRKSSSGIPGVGMLHGRWRAYYYRGRKQIYVGSFDTATEAMVARDAAMGSSC